MKKFIFLCFLFFSVSQNLSAESMAQQDPILRKNSSSRQKVNISKIYGKPYLAVSYKEHGNLPRKKQVNLLMKRVAQICAYHGYGSPLDFQLKRYKGDRLIALDFNNKEVFIEDLSAIKGWSIAIHIGLFALTAGVSDVVFTLAGKGQSVVLGVLALFAAEFAISYGLHKVTVERLKGVELEGMWKRYSGYFSKIICSQA